MFKIFKVRVETENIDLYAEANRRLRLENEKLRKDATGKAYKGFIFCFLSFLLGTISAINFLTSTLG